MDTPAPDRGILFLNEAFSQNSEGSAQKVGLRTKASTPPRFAVFISMPLKFHRLYQQALSHARTLLSRKIKVASPFSNAPLFSGKHRMTVTLEDAGTLSVGVGYLL